jgi:DNA-binding beta-propeller fold protein YncE
MKLSLKKTLLLIPLLSLFLVGCGKRTKLPTDIPQFIAQTSDTTYIPLTPVWTAAGGIDFDRPQDVHFGFDGHVYIADTGNDRVVEFDQAGNFIAQYDGIEEPWSISQDRLFRLQAVGGNTFYLKRAGEQSFDAIYVGSDIYDSTMVVRPDTIIDTLIISPDSMVIDTLTGLLDTTYIVHVVETSLKAVTSDPHAASDYATYFVCDFTRNQIVGFVFREPDELLSLGPVIPTGFDLSRTMYPTGVFAYLTAARFRFLFCQALSYYSVQLLDGEDFSPLIPRTGNPPPEIYWQGTFGRAEDVAVDEFENIFVVDQTLNQVHKFSPKGARILSFGEEGSGEKQFKNPMGIAYANKILYVADTGNNRILRFVLSTDFPH